MSIKTSDLNAKLFGKANKRRVATTVQEAQSAAKDKAQIIELAVAGEVKVEFELQQIPADQIEVQTRVFSQNAREQSFLTEPALADILTTLKVHGQQYPAVGRRTEDGTIEVLDGSRRRMSCLLAKQDFLIYVADNIESKHAKFLSDVANAHKPLSLYERGKEMQAKLDSGEASDQKALAAMFQCSEALVSGALKAASLPLELLQAYPNVSELGRPTIVKLHKQFFNLNRDQQQQLIERCHSNAVPIWQQSHSSGVARITKEVTEQLESCIDEIAPKPSKSTGSSKTELVKGKAHYVRKGQQLTLNLSKIDDALADEILSLIKNKIQ